MQKTKLLLFFEVYAFCYRG